MFKPKHVQIRAQMRPLRAIPPLYVPKSVEPTETCGLFLASAVVAWLPIFRAPPVSSKSAL